MIVIHIGLKKSGSASIQTFLAANEDALRSIEVDYSPVGRTKRKAHHNLASEAIVRKRFNADRGTLADVAVAARDSQARQIILSSEVFEGCEDHAVEYIKSQLIPSGREFRIVVVIRELMELITSSYAQKIRYGYHTYDFDSFFDARLNEKRIDYFETVNRWASAFGWDNIRVRPLDSRHLLNADLIDDFLDSAGVNVSDPRLQEMHRPGLVNAASGWKTLEAIRGLHSGRHGLPPTHPLAILVSKNTARAEGKAIEMVAQDISRQLGWPSDKSLYLTRAQAQQSLEIYAGAVEALNRRLPIALPTPRTLDERGFTERQFLPDISHISPVELDVFFDEIADSLFAEATGKARTGLDARIIEEVVGTRQAALLRDSDRPDATPTLLIETNEFYDQSDQGQIKTRIKKMTGGESIDVQYVPPGFLRRKRSGQLHKLATARAWSAVAANRNRTHLPKGPSRRLNVISLAFGRTLRLVGREHLTTLAGSIGGPVLFQTMCLPPTPILLSDSVFLEYFLPAISDPSPFDGLVALFDELRSADIIIVDDIAELQWPMRRFYPILSHQMTRSDDAELLIYRENAYVSRHNELPVAVIGGSRLGVESRDIVIDVLSNILNVPIFRIAATKALEEYTSDWDYRPMPELVGAPGMSGLDPDAFTGALAEWISRKANDGSIKLPTGEGTVKIARKSEQLAFDCMAADREGLSRVLDSFSRFRITGPRSSGAFIDKYLKAAGKSYVRTDSNEMEFLEAVEPFDCLIACGAIGPVNTTATAVALMPAGWSSFTVNAPAWLAEIRLNAHPAVCEHDQWYSPAPMQNRFTIPEREIVAEITRLTKEQRVQRAAQAEA